MRSICEPIMFLADAMLCATLLIATTSDAAGVADDAKAAAPLPSSQVTAVEALKLVAAHNAARSEVGVAPVAWSAEVASFAQQWADHIAATGKFEHRPYASEKSETDPVDPADDLPKQIYGENLAFGSGQEFGVTAAAEMWLAEKKDYVPGTPIPSDFSMFKAGHYTQMVWSKTTKIGAGRATIQTGDFKGYTVIVCNYAPGGNRGGVVPFEVPAKPE